MSVLDICADFSQKLIGSQGSAAKYVAAQHAFLSWFFVGPVAYFINAPFGRFSNDALGGIFNVNGNLAWFIMEIVSPITFVVSLSGPTLSSKAVPWSRLLHVDTSKLAALTTPTKIMAVCYIVHYINRSTISCLRTPTPRSPSNIIVPLSSVAFNLANGFLMGSWLGGRTSALTAKTGAVPQEAMNSRLFWTGVAVWAMGFAGNVFHDEILYNLRRPGPDGKPKPRYSIPQGWLYSWPFGGVSFPNYFCEWIEWLGFAVAACSYSVAPASPATTAAVATNGAAALLGNILRLLTPLPKALRQVSTYSSPPFMFFFADIAVMMPRAMKSHQWYKQKFGTQFPIDRKVAIPGLW